MDSLSLTLSCRDECPERDTRRFAGGRGPRVACVRQALYCPGELRIFPACSIARAPRGLRQGMQEHPKLKSARSQPNRLSRWSARATARSGLPSEHLQPGKSGLSPRAASDRAPTFVKYRLQQPGSG